MILICRKLKYQKLERISKRDRNARKKLIEERAYEIWVGIKATYNSPNRDYKPRDWKRLTNFGQNIWDIISPGVMEAVDSIPTWNSKIFSVVLCLVAKQLSLTSFIHASTQRHSLFHVSRCWARSVNWTHYVNKNPVKRPNARAQWTEHLTGVTEVVGSITTYLELWNLFSSSLNSCQSTITWLWFTYLCRHTANEDAYLRSFYLRFEDASDFKLCLLNFWSFSTNISIWFSNSYRILND